ERVFANLINNIDYELFDVTLVCFNNHNNVYKISPKAKVINLNVKRARNAPLRIIKLLRKEKPDLIISTLYQMNLMLMLLKGFLPKKTKIIIRHTMISSMSFSGNNIQTLINRRISKLYKKADKVICQSDFMKQDFIKFSGLDKTKIEVIYNPVDADSIL